MIVIVLSSGTFVNKDSISNDAEAYPLRIISGSISHFLLAVSKEFFITKLFWDNRFSCLVDIEPVNNDHVKLL